ncbi:helix-turn-helix domain-containing protein [Streptomyces echinatus]|uniref:helix-turn-helix domain-containing protein n=1 Tax=Streptomyces echinatus TaxID=67293 RepID=UPI0037A07450
MRHYRERRSRADVGLDRRPGDGRSTRLRQPDVDEALGCGVGVYQKVESGRLRPSPELFLRIAEALGFSPHDRRVAHLDLFGSEPPPPIGQPSPDWQRSVDGQREMMCVVAPNGKLVAYNVPFAAMFGDDDIPSNFWRWALLCDHARDTALRDWEQDWAPYLLEECRLLSFRYREHEAIRCLYLDLAEDPRLAMLPRVDADLNGRVGLLRHAEQGIRRVRIMAADSEGLRLLTFLPAGA